MAAANNDAETVRALLTDLTERELRAASVEALQRWRRTHSERVFSMHGVLGFYLLEVLSEAKAIKCDPNRYKEVFIENPHEPWLTPVLEFVWWMVRAGLAMALPAGQHKGYPVSYTLTSAGARFLDSAGEHPLAPGFLERLQARWPNIPDAAFALLLDANACLEAGLVRPAVTLLGVAYENVVEHALRTAGCGESVVNNARAWRRIELLRELIAKGELNKEERTAALRACDFADHLRMRRNDAAHTKPRFAFDSIDEGEELIVSTCRHLVAFAPLLR
jgi:hypothetical protein